MSVNDKQIAAIADTLGILADAVIDGKIDEKTVILALGVKDFQFENTFRPILEYRKQLDATRA